MTADETPHLRKGNSVWWHDKKAFLGGSEIQVEKIGNSFGHYYCLSKEKLQHLFASNGKTAKDFIKWAKSKNVKIHQSTISRQLSGKQGLTVAWELAYMAYFDSITKQPYEGWKDNFAAFAWFARTDLVFAALFFNWGFPAAQRIGGVGGKAGLCGFYHTLNLKKWILMNGSTG